MKQHQTQDSIHGLILLGGSSTRMGRNKAYLEFRQGIPQYEHLFILLSKILPKVFLSVESASDTYKPYPQIVDKFNLKGPLNGILSAMQHNPKAAWLVIPVDLPLLTQKTLTKLLNARNPDKFATALKKRKSEIPEPLIAIYEPKCFPILIQQKSHSPLDFLKNNPTELIEPNSDMELFNCNSSDDYQIAIDYLQKLRI